MLKYPLDAVGLGQLLEFPSPGMRATLPPAPTHTTLLLLMLEKEAFCWGSVFLFRLLYFLSLKY